ncbi:F-box protein SKIP23-like [Silene latifolia]|uniref:F-box protein SKIP23-like n=1 Tax=Silene latifolia TaxID=37657 RepID=UPI003D76B4BA
MALRCTRHCSTGGANDWAELPCDIIVSIFEHLDDYLVDIRRAASVCVAWRRAGSLLNSKKDTLIKLPSICTCWENKITGCLSWCPKIKYDPVLTQSSYYFLISPASNTTQTRVWMFRVEEIGTNRWLLLPPSTDRLVIPSRLEYNFNLLDKFKILGVAELHTLHYNTDIKNGFKGSFFFFWDLPFVRKVIPMSDLGKRFLVLFGEKGKLAMSSVDSQWSYIDTRNYEFDDIINLGGELYAIDTIGRLVMINPTTLDLVEIASPPKGIEYDVKIMYLVCSDGFLYLVYRGFVRGETWWGRYAVEKWNQSWYEFRPILERNCSPFIIGEPVGVLMFDKQNRVWVRLENIGDKVFFITKYVTFSVTAKELGLSRGSLIYYMGKDFHNGPDFGKALIVYKVEGNMCREQENLHSDITVDLGPPPSWVCPMPHSRKQ